MGSTRIVLVASLLLAAIAGACGVADSSQAPSAPPDGCLRLAGERVDSIRWSDDGNSVAVASFDWKTADGIVRRVTVPGLESDEVARGPSILTLAGVTNGSAGISWIEFDGSTTAVASADSTSGRLVRLPIARPVYALHQIADQFAGLDDQDGRSTIVAIERDGSFSTMVNPIGQVETFDAVADGSRLVYQRAMDRGPQVKFVLWAPGDSERLISPPGRLLLNPVLGVEPGFIYFENHDAKAFQRVAIDGGNLELVVGEDVSEAAISPHGLIAHTFVAPDLTDLVCVREQATR